MLGVRGANLSDAVRVHMRNSLFWTQHFRAPLIILRTHQIWNNASEKLQQMQRLRTSRVIVGRNISFFLCTPAICAKNQQETKIPSSYSGFRIGSLFFSENQQDQQEAISSQFSCSGLHIQGTSLSCEQQQQHQSSASSQAFSCVSAGTTHIGNHQQEQQQPSTSSQLAVNRVAAETTHIVSQQQQKSQPSTSSQLPNDGCCTGAIPIAFEQQQQQSSTLSQLAFDGFQAQGSPLDSQQHHDQQQSITSQLVSDCFPFRSTPLGDNQLQPQKHQLSACSQLAYEYPNHPTGMMSINSYEPQQPVPSFSGRLPQQQPYGELSPGANTRPFPFPKPGFPSPPDGVFHCYLLQFCPPQVSRCYGCNQMLKPEGRVVQPPFNLVVVTKMNRAYYSDGEKKCKLSNVYFYCRLQCVRQKQPYFLPTMCKILPKLTPFLLPCHKDVLKIIYELW